MIAKETKYCPHCKQSKPIGEFRAHKGRHDGRQSYCAICQDVINTPYAERVRATRKAAKEKARANPYNIEEVDAMEWANEYIASREKGISDGY